MASASAATAFEGKPTSEIIRTTDGITIKILNLEDSERIADEALADSANVKLIRSIVIETTNLDEDDDDDDDEEIDIQLVENLIGGVGNGGLDNDAASTDSKTGAADNELDTDIDDEEDNDSDDEVRASEELTKACKPIVQLLDTIIASGGALEAFSWKTRNDFWDNSKGKRPASFWAALWKHAPTLQKVCIYFNTHELHEVAGPSEKFPALRELYVDASEAHGDDGSAVEKLFSLCPELENLDFSWPRCDLGGCQIENITWDFQWPKLHSLALYGADYAPNALAKFLERHSSIEIFVDGVDTDFMGAFKDAEGDRLSPTSLPNVKAVDRTSTSSRFPEDWFNDEAGRKIAHFAIPWNWKGDLSVSKTMAKELKCLEINASNVTAWRPKEADSDDEEEEKKRIEQEPEKELVRSVRRILPELIGLRELGINQRSDTVTMRLPDGTHGSPPGMDEKDLKVVLSVLPPQSSIRALRVWDTKGKPLPQSLLDDFPSIPSSLEYLGWEGEEKVLYRFERGSGKVKAIPCEPLRVVGEEKKKHWNEKRILDFD